MASLIGMTYLTRFPASDPILEGDCIWALK